MCCVWCGAIKSSVFYTEEEEEEEEEEELRETFGRRKVDSRR